MKAKKCSCRKGFPEVCAICQNVPEGNKDVEPKPTAFEFEAPIHDWFELTYAKYLVLPRSVLQSLPVDFQRRFVEMLKEMETIVGEYPKQGTYFIYLRDDGGRFLSDPLADYERGRRKIKFPIE